MLDSFRKMFLGVLFKLFFLSGIIGTDPSQIDHGNNLIAIGALKSQLNSANDKLEASLNNYLDQVFTNLHRHGKHIGLEPLSLPNKTTEIDQKILFADLQWVFSLTNGTLTNLSSLQRGGDATLTYQNNIFEMDAAFEFPELQLQYDFETQLNNFGPKGKLYGKIQSLIVHAILEVDTDNVMVKLKKFSFPKCGKVILNVDTNNMFDIVINAIDDFITTVLKDPVLLIVQHEIRVHVQEILDNFFKDNLYIVQ